MYISRNTLEEDMLTYGHIHNIDDLNHNNIKNNQLSFIALRDLKENDIRSSGYVVDTLEAAIWCFLNTENYKACVLKAVNLGDDTDTVGAVAGGLAGLYYGLEDIPEVWVEILPKREWIIETILRLK